MERFHLRAARSFLERGELLLCSMTLDGRHIASFYGFERRKRMYYYISAVKKLPQKRVNVLDTLLGYCMEESINEAAASSTCCEGERNTNFAGPRSPGRSFRCATTTGRLGAGRFGCTGALAISPNASTGERHLQPDLRVL